MSVSESGPTGRPPVSARHDVRGLTPLVGTVVLVAGVLVGIQLLDAAQGGVGVLLACAAAAVTFGLAWQGLERLAGGAERDERPTPYSVLAAITAHTGMTEDDVPDLARLTETIGRGLGARVCRLTVHRPGLRDRTHAWTAPWARSDERAEVEIPIEYHGERIGSLAVDRRALVHGRPGTPGALVDDLTAALGAVLAIGRYSIDLERQLRAARAQAEQIAQGRRAAVGEMDHERRTIERNLHDGVQGHLVSLRLALALVEQQIHLSELERARDRVPALLSSVEVVENALADVSTGVATMVLRERGLVMALEADLADSEPPVEIVLDDVDPARRYPDLVEQTVYFCCLEAVNNARKHARNAAIAVEISIDAESLRFAVRDRGPGFVTDSPSAGRGLTNLTARAAAAGGSLHITSAPGSGTTVEGFVPMVRDPDEAMGDSTTDTDADGLVPPTPVPDESPSADAPEAATSNIASGHALRHEPGASTNGAAPPPPPLARGSLEWQVRAIAQAAAAACTEHPPRELDDLLSELEQHEGVDDGDPATGVRERARSALLRIEALLPALPIALGHGFQLREQLERLRVGAHEVRELELLEALERGVVVLPGDDLEVVRALLGANGTGAHVRLGLPGDVPRARLENAAQQHLAVWEGRAAHPASNRSTRWAAEVLIRTCEDLLISDEDLPRRPRTGGRSESP